MNTKIYHINESILTFFATNMFSITDILLTKLKTAHTVIHYKIVL